MYCIECMNVRNWRQKFKTKNKSKNKKTLSTQTKKHCWIKQKVTKLGPHTVKLFHKWPEKLKRNKEKQFWFWIIYYNWSLMYTVWHHFDQGKIYMIIFRYLLFLEQHKLHISFSSHIHLLKSCSNQYRTEIERFHWCKVTRTGEKGEGAADTQVNNEVSCDNGYQEVQNQLCSSKLSLK